MPADIEHPVLGTLSWKDELDSWESEIEFDAHRRIGFLLTLQEGAGPTNDLPALLRLGVELVDWARRTEFQCRQRIADELLDLYNDNWAPEDATVPMTRAEFVDRIAPRSLGLLWDGKGDFYWDAEDMFAGHWIEVRFSEDRIISEVGLAG